MSIFSKGPPPYGCRSVSKLKNGEKFVFARWGGEKFSWGGSFPKSGLDQILRKRPPPYGGFRNFRRKNIPLHMGGADFFAPQARPKMSDFEQKRQFFDVFSPNSAKFHPYEGGFLVKIENDVILKNSPSIWGGCIRAQQFKLFGVTHMGGMFWNFEKTSPSIWGGMF